MHLSRDQFAFLFEALMMRPPSAEEAAQWHTQDMTATTLVGVISQLPEFAMRRPFLTPKPLYEDLVPASANGVDFLVPTKDWVHWGTKQGWGWEPHVADAMRRFLSPGGVFVDVGANVGVHTVLGAKLVGETGHVYAIEASIEVAMILLLNARNTQLSNIFVIPRAVSDSSHHEHMMVANATTNRTVQRHMAEARLRHKFDPVLTDTMDNILGHLDRIDLIKIDIEGREGSALRGAGKVLERTRPTIIAEYHYKPPAGHDEGYYVEELMNRGYALSIISPEAEPLAIPGSEALRSHGVTKGLTYSDLLFTPRSDR